MATEDLLGTRMRLLLTAVVLLLSSNAIAGSENQPWPLVRSQRPLVLNPGMFEIGGETLRMNVSKGAGREPLSLAPDLFFGVSKKLTIGLTHATGMCLLGSDGVCTRAYNDLAFESLYGLIDSEHFLLAAKDGLEFPRLLDPPVAGLTLGVATKIRAGDLAVGFSPTLYIGVMGVEIAQNAVNLTTEVQQQVTARVALFVQSGISGALRGLQDTYDVPVALGALATPTRSFDIGATFRFTNLIGTGGGIEGRELVAQIAFRH